MAEENSTSLPESFTSKYTVISLTRVPAGRINACYFVSLKEIGDCFLKVNLTVPDKDFQLEAKQLQILSNYTRTPKVLDCANDYLLLERISIKKNIRKEDYDSLAKVLSKLHTESKSNVCGYDFDTYHSTRLMANKRTTSWMEFFRDTRFAPRLEELKEKEEDLSNWIIASKVYDLLPRALDDKQTTHICLLHGDMNRDNWCVLSKTNEVVLFDPNIFEGDYMFEIASFTCFGKMLKPSFFDNYSLPLQKLDHWPIREMTYHYYILISCYLMTGSTFLLQKANSIATKLIGAFQPLFFPSLLPLSHLKSPSPQEKLCVSVLSGTFSPVHLNHIQTLLLANDHLSSRMGYQVLGSFISPSSENSAKRKFKGGNNLFSLFDRVQMAKLAISNYPNFAVELVQSERYDILFQINHCLKSHFGEEFKIEIFLVCGSDKVPYIHSQTLPYRVITTIRYGVPLSDTLEVLAKDINDKIHADENEAIEIGNFIILRNHKEDEISSTLVRNKLEAKNEDENKKEAENMLHPDVFTYLVTKKDKNVN